MKMAFDLGIKEKAEIILATDPDGDRLGVAVPANRDKTEYVLLNGNQTCVLLTYYLCRRWSDLGKLDGKQYIVKTIVTTEMLAQVAKSFGIKYFDCLTGFKYIAEIIRALQNMSKDNIGALIILSNDNVPRQVLESGVALDAKISSQLIEGIFFPKAPLHDGAVILNKGRIVAARCILPSTQLQVPKSYGTRHRAALGMSEVSDAIVLVVSEETGGISIAQGGVIKRDIAPENLQSILMRRLNMNVKRSRSADRFFRKFRRQ